MKVYRPQDEDVPTHVLFFAPAANGCEGSEFVIDGKPRQFAVEFKAGVAQVESNIGRYLVDAGLAQYSPLHLPHGATLRNHHAGNISD